MTTLFNVAVVGATGAVGEVMRQCLEERNFPVARLRLMASSRSAGRTYTFRGETITVEEATEDSFADVDIALFSIPSVHTRRLSPAAARAGAVVIDNSSAFRMEPDVPLVVPEVNPDDASRHKGIIANPNCSTIQMVLVLKPLHDVARVKRVVVTTFQSVSGAGLKAVEELRIQTRRVLEGLPPEPRLFPHQIAFNALPQIPQSNAFGTDGYTTEEVKMRNETRKIMGDDTIAVTATCVRVPVFYAHSEAVNVETERPLSVEEASVFRPVYVDMVEDAVVLLDRGGFLERILKKVSKLLERLGSRRVRTGEGEWFWILKPGVELGEEVSYELE